MERRYKVVFMGTPTFAVQSLLALANDDRFEVVGVVTQPDRPVGRKQKLQKPIVGMVAEARKIPVLQPVKIRKNQEFLEQLKTLAPDVIVVAAYGKILPQEILDIPLKGIVNVHASFLPKYRGASPISAAILNGDNETGVTIMKMALAMDTGDIIAKSTPVRITDRDDAETLMAKLAEVGAKTLIESLPKYLDGEITPTPQSEPDATYVKMLQKEDGMIDWHNDEDYIARQVRAYTPWPSAYTTMNNQLVKILSVEVNPAIENPRGTIAKIDGQLYIGKLKIRKLQLAGKKPMDGKALLAGYPQLVGTRLI